MPHSVDPTQLNSVISVRDEVTGKRCLVPVLDSSGRLSTNCFPDLGPDIAPGVESEEGVQALIEAAIADLPSGGGSGPTIVRKTSQTVKGDPTGGAGTEALDPALKFPVLNGETWIFDMMFDVSTGESSGGGILACVGGAAGTISYETWEYFQTDNAAPIVPVDGAAPSQVNDASHLKTITPGSLMWASGAKRALVRVHCVVTATASGDVGLSWTSVGFGLDAKVLSGHIIANKVG